MDKIKRIIPSHFEESYGDSPPSGLYSCEVELEDGTILEGYVYSCDGCRAVEYTLELSIEDVEKYGFKNIKATF